MNNNIHVFSDLESLSRAAAERWAALARHSIAMSGQFHVALTGGATPQRMYEYLAQPEYRDRVAWRHVHIYFGDERHVPPEHPDSNFRMANEALLAHVPIPPLQIHHIQGEVADATLVAETYAKLLDMHAPKSAEGRVQFDLILLGVGPDGHIASLFPDTAILQERTQWAAAVYVEKLHSWRVSITLPVINYAKHIMMLVAGAAKADILRQVFSEDRAGTLLPVQMLKPHGAMEWYLDQAAASHLPEKGKK